jgi:hypothetical protein
MDQFWELIDAQLLQARGAKTAADVLQIFAVTEHNSPAFFGGSGGDNALDDALYEAGWTYVWSKANYWWAMRAPDGTGITYVEGDIYDGVEEEGLGREQMPEDQDKDQPCGVCGIRHRPRSRCACRTGYASNPQVHNNQVRAYGRCSCECHGR